MHRDKLENMSDEEAIEEMKDKICNLQNIFGCPYVEHPKCGGTCNWYKKYSQKARKEKFK